MRETNIRDSQQTHSASQNRGKQTHKDARFYGIIVALSLASSLGGLETTVVTTSLPAIIAELNIGTDYVWITNVLFLTR